MYRLRYQIKGMSCAACVAHVERAVRSVLDKADSFTVSLLTNSISILLEKEPSANEKEILEKRLTASVKAAGYTLLTDEKKEKGENRHAFRKDMIRLGISALFTLALSYLSMGGMIGLPIPSSLSGAEHASVIALTQLALTIPVLFLNFKFFKNGAAALFHLSPNMDSLIAIGAGASVIYGIVTTLLILFSPADHQTLHTWLHSLYFESAAMILTLVSFGKLLESRAKDKAANAVRSLAALSPKFALVLREGKEIPIPVEEIRVGDILLVRAGEMVAVDGVVIEGNGSTDESALTGESMPIEKSEGSEVRAACVLTSGALRIRATGVGEDSSLSRIIRLLEDTAASKAPIARIADRVSGIFVPVVIGISLLTFLLWMLIAQNIEQALRSAISVLVISCPCALGLATPTAITVGVGRGARMGVLFRSAEALERLSSIQTAVFDKTGTVTEGKPSLTELYVYTEDAAFVLGAAGAVEQLSAHPLAQAICRAAEQVCPDMPKVTEFQSLVGIGAQGIVNGRLCKVGKPDGEIRKKIDAVTALPSLEYPKTELFSDLDTTVCVFDDASRFYADFAKLEQEGKTAVAVTIDATPVAVMGISDRIRADSKTAVDALKSFGVTCLMLTGDQERTAAFVAKEVDLDGYYAALMPEDKERMVRQFSQQAPCAMIGDGINDAPALVRADVGIAIGAGTEVAIDSADVVLSGNSLSGVAEAFAISRATLRVIKQNLFWALFYNAVCIPVAAGLFYSLLGWQLSPMIASAAMSFSSVCVVSNALRLKTIDLHKKTKNKKTKEGYQKMFGKKREESTYVLKIEGMMCHRCVAHVKEALESVKGVRLADVSLEEKTATVTGSVKSAEPLIAAVKKAGYEIAE